MIEIIPFVGFEEVRLGVTEEMILEELGPSEERNEVTFDDGAHEVELEYNALGVSLTFSSDDNFRLGSITFIGEEFVLGGVAFIGESLSFLLSKINECGVDDLILAEEFQEIDSKDYYADSIGCSFWVNNGTVVSISIMPKYEEDGNTVFWPA